MRLVVRVLINAAALWVADQILDGIELTGNIWGILLVALVFGLINAALLGITAALMDNLTVDGFWSAVLGGLIIAIVSAVLSRILPDD